jgi:hypothetical protein
MITAPSRYRDAFRPILVREIRIRVREISRHALASGFDARPVGQRSVQRPRRTSGEGCIAAR